MNGGKAVRLPEQPFPILVMLLECPGEVISREEIRKRRWPNDTIVEFEHSISAAMNRLRQVKIWFNRITLQAFRRRTLRRVKELAANIENCLQTSNATTATFV